MVGTQISNEAFAVYDKGIELGRTATSNKVSITVGQVVSFIFNPDSTRVVAPGNTLNLPYTVTNTGNGADQINFAVTDVAGGFGFTNVQVYPDANGDGLPDANSLPIASSG
ncbi:MAG: hypothetical protein RL020_1310, partial [Pseudomonadota bacterium]